MCLLKPKMCLQNQNVPAKSRKCACKTKMCLQNPENVPAKHRELRHFPKCACTLCWLVGKILHPCIYMVYLHQIVPVHEIKWFRFFSSDNID